MDDCIFCSIVAGAIPADVVLDRAGVLAFRDLSPQAPTHVLVIPKPHHATVAEVVDADPALAAELMAAVAQTARELGLGDGYRIVFNTGADGGQTVAHAHAHVLGGRPMGWPPG